MSETIHVVGILIPVKMVGDIESTAKSILVENDIDLDLYRYESYVEQLQDIWYKQYCVTDDKIYMIEDVEDVWDTQDIFNSHENDNGTISFEVKFYDGGCSFDEALGYAVNR